MAGARKRDETKGKEYESGGEHGVRFSDKISNLKFHRNFTILGSKLIVLSTGTFQPPPPLARLYRNPPVAFHLTPAFAYAYLRERNFENKQPITHYSPRLSERLRGVPESLSDRSITSTLIYKVSEIQPVRGYATSTRYIDIKSH